MGNDSPVARGGDVSAEVIVPSQFGLKSSIDWERFKRPEDGLDTVCQPVAGKVVIDEDVFGSGHQYIQGGKEKHVGSSIRLSARQTTTTLKRYNPSRRPECRSEVHIDYHHHVICTGDVSNMRGIQNHWICQKWYSQLGYAVQKNIDRAGFGEVVKILGLEIPERILLNALSERWWDTTHTFHFDNIGELTMTPTDFSALTGLQFSGKMVSWDDEAETKKDLIEKMFGKPMLNLLNGEGGNTWGDLYGEYFNFKTSTNLKVDQLTRVFLLALVGSVLCTDSLGKVNLSFMSCLSKIDSIKNYNWGAAALAAMYDNMDAMSRARSTSGCIWKLWEVWACIYMKPLSVTTDECEEIWPVARRWIEGAGGINITLAYRELMRNLKEDDVVFNPWGGLEGNFPEYMKKSEAFTNKRILLPGIAGYSWYLGERVTRQSLKLDKALVPVEPPMTMLGDCTFTDTEIEQGIVGWPASDLISHSDDDYKQFVRTYIVYNNYPESELKLDEPPRGIDIGDITIPPWSINVVKFGDEYKLHLLDIPRNEPSPYYPLSENIKAVSAETANALLMQIAGLTAIAGTQAWKAKDECTKALQVKEEELSQLRDKLYEAENQIVGLQKEIGRMTSNLNPYCNNERVSSRYDTPPRIMDRENQKVQYREQSGQEMATNSGGESCGGDGQTDIDPSWLPTNPTTWQLPPRCGQQTTSKRSRV